MAQVSRPFQIALAAVAVLGLVWAVALRGHAANTSEPAPSAPAASPPLPSAAAQAKAPGAPTSVYHGAAPGVEGLTRAIAKARGAVALSQKNAAQLQRKSSEASGDTHAGTPSTSATTNTSAVRAQPARKSPSEARHSRTPSKPHSSHPAQAAVEHELAGGKTVMLVFWNPHSTVDAEVRSQAGMLVRRSKGRVTLHAARANQVGMFGSITEVVHVYQTPTILIVNKKGVVSTLTGLTDVFALEQAVREARNASA
jgi:hypothetical protein